MSSSHIKVKETNVVNDQDLCPTKSVVLKESGSWDTIGRLSTLKRNLKTLSSHSTKKITDDNKDKNEPSRFLGEGVSYKAKLIGILEVSDPRGDRMCQEALADLKMAIRAAGEHKQRITVNIAIDGLRLRDEKTGDCLYHHPVHKISFIAQDMTDSRAFGYIFGSPDTGHRFFGIKTDKAASQVVISMRDLFQVVFELKKKEIEMTKQHIEQHQIKFGYSPWPGDLPANKSVLESTSTTNKRRATDDGARDKSSSKSSGPSEVIADLLDLEFELNNIQQGLNQMERITPSDPFGDSFSITAATKTALPPTKPTPSPKENSEDTPAPLPTIAATKPDMEKHWFDRETEDLFDESEIPKSPLSAPSQSQTCQAKMMEETLLDPSNTTRDQFDVFTELDPLGTGKSKPYIDKKDFFQELKNPPKKVLKDLVVDIPKETHNQTLQSTFEISGSSVEDTQSKDAVLSITTDPFGDDPFDKTDPFTEADLCQAVGFSSGARLSPDPFDSSFADFTKFSDHSDFSTSNSFDTPNRKSPQFSDGSPPVHGPLRVSLPPDKQCDSLDLGSPKLSQSPPTSRHRSKYSRIHKQTTSGMIKLPSPKQKGRSRISKQNTLDSSYDRNSPLMDGVSSKHRGMSSSSPPNISFFGEVPPEPPPRPTMTSTLVKPPLLPPKRQLQTAVMKPPPPPQSDDCTHYDYIKNCESLEDVPDDVESPPIPVPARRLRFGGDESAVPNRPSKANLPCQSEPEYYLTPIPLLPPPQKKGASTKNSSPVNPRVFTRPSSNNAVNSLDITLSQLTKTGFSDLAATLNMSPTSLSKMTLQELTKCLQTLSEAQKNSPYTDEFIENGGKIRKNVLKSEQYSALRESIDEDIPPFKAEFESHFNLNLAIKPYSKEDESLFDKYSVFRELLEQEKTIFEDLTANSNNDQSSNEEPMTINPKYEDIEETRKDNMVQTQSNVNKVSKITETLTKSAVDRYAALRDICLDDLMDSKDTDEKDETDPLSDKDDSIAEVTRCDDELDTLTLSRPHSESTDSPTATIKESQSIMESTILEEDASALDDEDGVYDETGDLRTILPTVAESNESITVSDSPQRPVLIKEPSVSSLQSLKGDGFTNNIKEKETDFNPAAEGWAKFDNGLMEAEKSGSLHSDGNISPWSIDSKETPKEQYSPSWPDHPEKKSRKGRRHKGPSVNNWQDDDESEEGWDNHCRSRNTSWNEPSWRENGWSDGDSMYDESSAYDGKHHSQYYTQRRGRRRKISPWRKSSRDPSPWEDDDRELSKDQWEEKRWEETRWQNRPKHRGSSWEEERRRDMYRNDLRREESRRDDSRKRRQSPWSTEGERKSSRESLTWEDDERYSRRNYRDRRRRRWEEGNYPRKDWRDRDQGRRNYHYYRDRSHESPWEDEFSEQGDEDSPRSQTRKQSWSRPRNSENEHYDQRYGRPSSGEDQNIPESNSNWAIKSQTLQIRSRTNKNKKRSQNSPFEDDFSIHNISFGSEKSPGAGSDFSDHGIKPIHQKSQSSPDEVFKRKGFSDSVEFSSQEGRGITPRSRHSPFEDDFTPAETRQTKTRHTTREVSDNRLLFEDQRSGDDVYIDTNMSSSNSDVINRLHSSKIVKKVIKQPLVSRKTKVNASGDHHIDKPRDAYLDKSKAESDTLNEELAIKRTLGKKHEHDLPPEVSSLRKNESLSLKQDSVNIFARSSDPFDDDFFSTESSSCNIEKSNDDKTKNRDPFKWTQAFSAFNFDEESK